MLEFLKPGKDTCDFSCLDMLFLGGSAVHKELAIEIKVGTYLLSTFWY